jgi:hypothetical protein
VRAVEGLFKDKQALAEELAKRPAASSRPGWA